MGPANAPRHEFDDLGRERLRIESKGDPRFQYAYFRTPLYCEIEERVLDALGWNFFDDLDGDLSAPEALPIGAATSPCHGQFAPREWEFHQSLQADIAAWLNASANQSTTPAN